MAESRITFYVDEYPDGHFHAWLADDYPRDDEGWGSDTFAAIADLCSYLTDLGIEGDVQS